MAERICFFDWKFGCKDNCQRLIEAGSARIQNIIRCSRIYDDEVHISLQEKLQNNANLTIDCHKSCVSSYTSTHHIKVFNKRKHQEPSSCSPTKTRRQSSDCGKFDIIRDCLFCGEKCELQKDSKNPSRWRPAYKFRQILSPDRKTTLKESILEACAVRNDHSAEQVRLRIHGIVCDLTAAEARYHTDCRASFMSLDHLTFAASKSDKPEEDDHAMEYVIGVMKKDQSQIWNSIDLYELYIENGGKIQSRKTLLRKLSDFFGDDLIVLHSAGLANIVCFRCQAAKSLRLMDEDDDEMDLILNIIAKKIISEVKGINLDKNNYSTTINKDIAMNHVSETLMTLLGLVSTKLEWTFPAIMIGSILTGSVRNNPTALQITLGSKLGRSKNIITTMQSFGVTCSYDEVLRFKRSAAKAATMERSYHGISDASEGLVQIVADNFDAEISSQNGKLSTHSLAVLATQPESPSDADMCHRETIPRISKEEMSEPIEYDVTIQRYNGPKKTKMPKSAAVTTILPLKLLAQQASLKRRADETDFAFFQDVLKHNCPEYNGYNTALTRKQGQTEKPKTKTAYLPLIDLVPSHPDTIMTAMVEAQKVTHNADQNYVLLTCDLQLYKVVLNVKWAYPERFSDVIPRLGGMHFLMSFIGCIGTLMENSGLEEVLSDVFGGVSKMLTGKKFPQNVRALRMVAEEVLRRVHDFNILESKGDLIYVLENIAKRSKTAKLWVDMLIKPVFLIMNFVRAEREADWLLHLQACKLMLPYFFAAGHVHYARYGLCYLRAMEALPEEVLDRFMKGEHVMRHQRGLWNGLWSDMFIETTFMRYGHAPNGIIGITLKPDTLKVWALSLHTCSSLEAALDEMLENSGNQGNEHKEEKKARIENDNKDREAIRTRLQKCIDPLDPEKHPQDLVNIATGLHGTPEVNVHEAVKKGFKQMCEFGEKLPDGFHETIHKTVTTMVATKKHVNVGGIKVYDMNVIYSRIIGQQASGRDVDIKAVLSYELAPVPTSMFDPTGEMRAATSKSSFKQQLQVEVSARTTVSETSVVVIDGSALLWVIPWPAEGTTTDFTNNLKHVIAKKLKAGDVHLVFDRYYDYSTKSVTRKARASGVSQVHKLQLNTKLPPQKTVLTVTENKKQLINLIVNSLIEDKLFHECTQSHKLILIGEDAAPFEISNGGVVIRRADLSTSHEEADNIIVQQVMLSARNSEESDITVISDDTDVFILLLHYYHAENMKNRITMESPIKERRVIDIGKTVEKHVSFVSELLPAHALTGCDTVACYYGVGKGTALKVLKDGHSLSLLGVIDSPIEAVIAQATKFISACYGQYSTIESMSETRWRVWASKTGRTSAVPTKLCSLPPTSEAFKENVKRAHHQAIMWRSLEDSSLPELDVEMYGWVKDSKLKTLQPVLLPINVELAPETVMRMIKCGCKSANPCRTLSCSCKRDGLNCTIFCACYAAGCSQTLI